MYGVRPDRFDHQVEFLGTVDIARYAVRLIRRDELSFGEVVQTVNALGVAVQEARVRDSVREGTVGAGPIIAPAPRFSQAEFKISCRVGKSGYRVPANGVIFPDVKTGGNAAPYSGADRGVSEPRS